MASWVGGNQSSWTEGRTFFIPGLAHRKFMVYITRVSPVLHIYLFGAFEEIITDMERLLTKITGEKAEMRIQKK